MNTTLSHTPTPNTWRGQAIKEVWTTWWKTTSPSKARNLPLLFNWEIWITRNHLIFQGITPHWPSISTRILADYSNIPEDEDHAPPRHIILETIDHTQPWAYFDGSTQETGCGGGVLLYLTDSHLYHIQMGLGGGMNNYASSSQENISYNFL